jgi:hypothetical protein
MAVQVAAKHLSGYKLRDDTFASFFLLFIFSALVAFNLFDRASLELSDKATVPPSQLHDVRHCCFRRRCCCFPLWSNSY